MKAIGTPDPARAADTIMGFEREIADKSWKIAERRDIDKLNNPYSTAELVAYAPGIDWAQFFAGARVPAPARPDTRHSWPVDVVDDTNSRLPS